MPLLATIAMNPSLCLLCNLAGVQGDMITNKYTKCFLSGGYLQPFTVLRVTQHFLMHDLTVCYTLFFISLMAWLCPLSHPLMPLH